MRCERAKSLYEEYTRGSLPVSTMARVEEHLATCPACREFFEQSDTIARLMRGGSEIAHPGPAYFDDLTARVLKQLDQPADPLERDPASVLDVAPSAWRRPLWWVGAAAAAALFALGLLPQNFSATSERAVAMARIKAASERATQATAMAAGQRGSNGAPNGGLEGRELAGNRHSLSPLSGQMLIGINTGMTGKGENKPAIEQMINQQVATGSDGKANAEGADAGKSERQAEHETEIKLASLKRKSPSDALSSEVFERLQALESELNAGHYEAARKLLAPLEDAADARETDQIELNGHPLYRQARLFFKAEDSLEAGRLDGAIKLDLQILVIDDQTRLAVKASLQLADLFYSEYANFSGARDYYQRCQGPAARAMLTPIEREHVTRQLDRLDRYKDLNWQALEQLDKIHRGKDWGEVLGALRSLTSVAGTDPLLPEAARTVRERMAGAGLSGETTLDFYNLLANKAKEEQNGEVRAWLELELGEMAFTQFQNAQQAKERFRHAAAASESSGAAKLARKKLAELEESYLTEPLRHRK